MDCLVLGEALTPRLKRRWIFTNTGPAIPIFL